MRKFLASWFTACSMRHTLFVFIPVDVARMYQNGCMLLFSRVFVTTHESHNVFCLYFTLQRHVDLCFDRQGLLRCEEMARIPGHRRDCKRAYAKKVAGLQRVDSWRQTPQKMHLPGPSGLVRQRPYRYATMDSLGSSHVRILSRIQCCVLRRRDGAGSGENKRTIGRPKVN